MDAFLTYCFLQRTGYAVRRCPCVWTINEGRLVDVHKYWAPVWSDSARICAANGGTNMGVEHTSDPVTSAGAGVISATEDPVSGVAYPVILV